MSRHCETAQLEYAGLFRDLKSPVFQVDPDHLTSRGGSDASGELSDEAHPYYGDALPEAKVALAEAVQSYRSKRRKRRIDDWDGVWDRDTEVGWYGKQLRMRRLFAAAGDEVPGRTSRTLAPTRSTRPAAQ